MKKLKLVISRRNPRALVLGVLFVSGMMVVSLGFCWNAEAGSKEFEAQKRNKYEDDTIVSIQESMKRQQEEETAFRKELLDSSRKTNGILTEIKAVLEEIKENSEKEAAAAQAAVDTGKE